MDIIAIQEKIDGTQYWDERILAVNFSYFGDEVEILVDNSEEENSIWSISFLSCYKVSYVTDADWRHIENVKDMKGGQLGYFGQKIEVTECENEKFICASIDLSIMRMEITCKNIWIEEKGSKN